MVFCRKLVVEIRHQILIQFFRNLGKHHLVARHAALKLALLYLKLPKAGNFGITHQFIALLQPLVDRVRAVSSAEPAKVPAKTPAARIFLIFMVISPLAFFNSLSR